MWPWLIGAGVLALLATSSKAAARAPLFTSSTSHPVAHASASNNVPLTPANIQKAQSIALAHETNKANLTAFGNALIKYGYTVLGQALIDKTLSHAQITAKGPNISGLWIPFWVNKYAPATYKSTDSVSASDLAKAVQNAINKAPSDQLTGFANALTSIHQTAYALQLQHRVATMKGHK